MPKGERGIFGTNIDPREAQAKSAKQRKQNNDRLNVLKASFGVEPLTQQESDEYDRILLAMTLKQLKETAQRDDIPLALRNRARLLIGEAMEAFNVDERMRDRVFGKPVQRVDANVQQAPPPTIADIFTDD